MPVSNQSETIDPRILRLIGLDDVFDLDYETYFTLLREALVKANMPGKSIPTEEFEMLSNEIKRVKSKKDDGRFQVKKKKITAGSLGLNVGKSKKLLSPVGAIAKSPSIGDLEQGISEIKEVMVSILETLKLQQKADKDAAENERRKAEKEKRGLAEDKLEKRFEGIKKAAEKIIAPVKSLFDRLFQFIGTVLLGRIVFKLIEWLGDKKNADKVRSLLRFFGDHWPKLLALYITFGTSFGKFARGLISLVVRGTALLVRATAGLAAKVLGGKLGGRLGKVSKFLGGGKGKLLVGGIEAAATIGGTLALSKGLENFSGIGGEEKAQGLAGGGYVRPRFPAFSGGGFNFKGMFGNLFGGSNGYVSGEKGVDKVPAMLSDGEFVMSVGAVQKYGVDTLEAMNAAGGGTNKPKIMSGTTYAQGGGLIGDIPLHPAMGRNPHPDSLRRIARTLSDSKGRRWGTEDELFQIFKKLNGVPWFEKILGKDNYSLIQMGREDGHLDAMRKSLKDKLHEVIKPQSFTQSSRAAAGLDDLAKKFDIDAKTAPRYAENLPKLNKPKPKLPTFASQLSPSYFLRGQSIPFASPLPEDYFLRGQSSLLRTPLAQSSFNRYRPGATIRATGPGMQNFPELQRFAGQSGINNPRIRGVPGGFGNLKSLGVELLANYLMERGFDKINAMIIAKKIDEGNRLKGENKEKYIENLRKSIDKEERWQRGFGGIFDKIIGLGKESFSEKTSRMHKEILQGMGYDTYKGGAIKGGYGLKQQSFKDMPKTQIMTDDNGKPFVGYKAMRGGKPVYVRGPQPGTGTSNPFEALGRMINPGAYRDIDAINARKKYEQASANNIASLRARGASEVTIARTQAQLTKTKPPVRRIVPLPKSQPRYNPAGGGMGGARGSGGGARSSRPQTPSFSATNPRGSNAKAKTLGVRR